MSYCRFSSDDFQCDVYCYESVHRCWQTHVAQFRSVRDDKYPPPVSMDDVDAWVARHQAFVAWLATAERINIGLPHDGESFVDNTPGEAADRLQSLKDMGYMVPQYAIDALREEQREAEGGVS